MSDDNRRPPADDSANRAEVHEEDRAMCKYPDKVRAIAAGVRLRRTSPASRPRMSVGRVEDEFSRFLSKHGLASPRGYVPADGRWHHYRHATGGNCSAVLNADGCPRGTVVSHRSGEHYLWTPDGVEITAEDRTKFERENQDTAAAIQQRAAHKAQALYSRLPSAPADYRYLRKKEIAASPCKVSVSGRLAVPVRDAATDEFLSIQWIDEHGEKRFMAGGRTKGGCCVLGELADTVIVCEGYATAASLYAATGLPTIAAFSAGNLLPVASAIRQRQPDCRLIIAADNDTKTDGNPGVTKGREAAQAVGGWISIPPSDGDYNDLFCDQGAKAVSAAIDAAKYMRPTIRIQPGALPRMVGEAVRALRAAECAIYNRGGILVRPMRLAVAETVGGVSRPQGALILSVIKSDWITLKLSEVAVWEKWLKTDRKWVAADPHERVAKTVVTVPDHGNWRPLHSIVRLPVLMLDGEWQGKPGYARGLYVDIEDKWREPKATRVAAEHALRVLRHHYRYMPFASTRDQAVALSLLLTAIMRPLLDAAPMHAIDAPAAGTGKSLLADTVSILATGARAAVMEYGKQEIEAAKRLDAALLAGDPFLAIDNVETVLEGAALCQTLTQPTRRIRVLGSHDMPHVPCAVTVVVTGNNLTVRGDLVRRTLTCRLDAKCERPDQRHIDQDLIAETYEYRKKLVAAAQTIMRAYIAQGRPDMSLAPLGLFTEWSRTVRGALVWLGLPDPAESVQQLMADDPSRQATRSVLSELHKVFGGEAVTVARMIRQAGENGALHEALALVCQRDSELNSRALSAWLRKHRDTRSGELVLLADDSYSFRQRWRVTKE